MSPISSSHPTSPRDPGHPDWIERRLLREVGLNPKTLGPRGLEMALSRRWRALGLSSREEYWHRLDRDPEEWDLLVQEVMVPETWFFRDREPFVLLSELVQGALTNLAPLRILSAPCSTGEEPYSIAITLLAAGLAPDRFRIDAVDIHGRSLVEAQTAWFGPHSFRGNAFESHARYFEAGPEGHRPIAAARQCVRFFPGNLVRPEFFADRPPYDIVFCRNLLIYLDGPARKTVLGHLERLTREGGWLFVGHADASLIGDVMFQSASKRSAFAFRKQAAPPSSSFSSSTPSTLAVDRPALALRSREESHRPGAVIPYEKKLPDLVRWPNGTSPPPKQITTPVVSSAVDTVGESIPLSATAAELVGDPLDRLARAGQLADSGRLEEAATLCDEYLSAFGHHPEAYFLLGMIQQARGAMAEAEANFRKVVYLDEGHYEAMLHLALASEERGDRAAADLLRRRAERIVRERPS